MSIKGLTASALWRAEPCPASVVLPASPRRYRDAKKGNDEHAELRKATPPGSLGEASFAYNVLVGEARFLGQDLNREYGEPVDGEIAGTLDVLDVQADHVLVTDFKTGHGYMQAEPAINPQLQHNAIAAATFHNKPRAIVQLIYTKTGDVKDAEFDALDLAAIHVRLLSIWTRVRAAQAALTMDGDLVSAGLIQEGDCCWRCPAEKACPLKHPKRRTA